MSRYFFTQVGNNAVCLLCSQTVSVNKKYNVSRHYQLKHLDYGKNLSVEEREARAKELDKKLARQQNVFLKSKSAEEASTRASFLVSYNIAKHLTI